ncbi:MAG: long-chain fatty acid--CoA ligase, partial [Deltaproteobacteria bacterium]
EGFFHTGDRGMIDDQGYFYFRSRMTEMIKTGGLNISPLEVETYLTTHPKVIHAYVLGIPDKVKGELVGAVIVSKDGVECSAQEIRDFCRGKISSYKIPEHIQFVEQETLPLTASGKVQKHKLLELFNKK